MRDRDDPSANAAGEKTGHRRPGWLKAMPFWTISATLHLALLLVLVALVLSDGPIVKDHFPEFYTGE